jgi:4a-hydroxytetrahydrobiopterin dehydratase
MAALLDEEMRQQALAKMPQWTYDTEAGSMTRQFEFENFIEAFGFMAQVALLAEKAGHHPDWSNSYDRVTITLSTHDAGGLTRKDIDLATVIDELVA